MQCVWKFGNGDIHAPSAYWKIEIEINESGVQKTTETMWWINILFITIKRQLNMATVGKYILGVSRIVKFLGWNNLKIDALPQPVIGLLILEDGR